MVTRALLVLGMMGLSGCAASAAAVTNAALTTAVAASVSGARRAQGECFTPCNPGTRCNKETGYCDPLPCGGKCEFDQQCVVTVTGEECRSTQATKPLGP